MQVGVFSLGQDGLPSMHNHSDRWGASCVLMCRPQLRVHMWLRAVHVHAWRVVPGQSYRWLMQGTVASSAVSAAAKTCTRPKHIKEEQGADTGRAERGERLEEWAGALLDAREVQASLSINWLTSKH